MKRFFSLLIIILTCLLAACGVDSTPDTTADPISSLTPEELVRAAVEESDLKNWGTSSNSEPYSPLSILHDYVQFPALHALLNRDDLDTFFIESAIPVLREYLTDEARAETPDYWKNAMAIADMTRYLCPHISHAIDTLFKPAELMPDVVTEVLIDVFTRDTRLQNYLRGGQITRHALKEFAKECPELSSILARDNDIYALCSYIELNHPQLREELGDAQADALLEIVWLYTPHNICCTLDNEALLRCVCERNYLDGFNSSESDYGGSFMMFADYATVTPPLYELLSRNDGLIFMKERIPTLAEEYRACNDPTLTLAAMKLEFIYEILFP